MMNRQISDLYDQFIKLKKKALVDHIGVYADTNKGCKVRSWCKNPSITDVQYYIKKILM